MKITSACVCCPACDHDAIIEGQYGPCRSCQQSISGKPVDLAVGAQPARILPGTTANPID